MNRSRSCQDKKHGCKSNEYRKAHDDNYVAMTTKGSSKGYVKRDHGPPKHHVPYGRHKADEKILDPQMVHDVLQEMTGEYEL